MAGTGTGTGNWGQTIAIAQERACGRTRGFTLVEMMVIISIIGIFLAVMLPAVHMAREAARRAQCMSNLKQIGLALQGYVSAMGTFPPGAVLDKVDSAVDYNIRKNTEQGPQGTSWMLQILSQVGEAPLARRWDFRENLASADRQHSVGPGGDMNNPNPGVAQTDIPTFYCPSRRSGVRQQDWPMMFVEWKSGGTDYGGCLGRANAWINSCTDSTGNGVSWTIVNGWCAHILVADDLLRGSQRNTDGKSPPINQNNPGDYMGIFGPNRRVRPQDIRDGATKTIAIGELQRLVPRSDATGYDATNISEDGWAVAGAATLFVTAIAEESGDKGQLGGLNNHFFESAGSEHPGGANFGFADGAVHFIANEIDPQTYAYLGSYSDGIDVGLHDQ